MSPPVISRVSSGAGSRARRRILLAALMLAAALPAACGKRAALRPPDGAEASYTYPRPYPAPETVVPAAPSPATESEEDGGRDDPLSAFPYSRTRSKTYGAP